MAKNPERFKVIGDVFDRFTEAQLFKLISQGYFKGLDSPLSVGKEANVFTARAEDGTRIIVKVYMVRTANFNKMYEYLRADPRLRVQRQRRKIIFAWAAREYRNLLKAREAGCRVPTALAQKFNVLVMECVGDPPAQKVKDDPPKNARRFFDLVVKNMAKLYKAGMVHGDLSLFNILNLDDEPVFIDMSQATTLENPNAEAFLVRDVRNIAIYFRKLGVPADETKMLADIRAKI
ncbi:serine protein kinase RIO [Candidatus Woesearchaeota archaeon]|nr:serine protein kinase RIO [Candidatus Woesearchaeota archaeon]